jgi:hypothetical protein
MAIVDVRRALDTDDGEFDLNAGYSLRIGYKVISDSIRDTAYQIQAAAAPTFTDANDSSYNRHIPKLGYSESGMFLTRKAAKRIGRSLVWYVECTFTTPTGATEIVKPLTVTDYKWNIRVESDGVIYQEDVGVGRVGE